MKRLRRPFRANPKAQIIRGAEAFKKTFGDVTKGFCDALLDRFQFAQRLSVKNGQNPFLQFMIFREPVKIHARRLTLISR